MTEALAQAHVAYVSDLELRRAGGGSYSVNWHAFRQLAKRFNLSYAGPLTPTPPWVEDSISKLRRRVLKRPGKFAYFSSATLDRNAQMVAANVVGTPDAIVFRSATRWCRCRPRVPYFVYLDAVFHTFFFNTFDPASFDRDDLDRIWREETTFLENASGVFFESEWGLAKARDAYGLRGEHYFSPGRGGAIDPPGRDVWDGTSTSLITVAMNFRQKGGDIMMDAFRQLSPRFPRLVWHVIGPPPEDVSQTPSIVHEGVLDPDDTNGLARLRDLLSKAFLIVHPTREDTSPLVLTEAAYFGCPAVSVNRFAIPELVVHGDTGILVDYPASGGAIAAAIARLLDDRQAYLAMRRRARERALEKYSWDAIGRFMCDRIARHLPK